MYVDTGRISSHRIQVVQIQIIKDDCGIETGVLRNSNLAVEAAMAALDEDEAVAWIIVSGGRREVGAECDAGVERIGDVKGAADAGGVYGDGELGRDVDEGEIEGAAMEMNERGSGGEEN